MLGDLQKPKIVLVHGYASSMAMMFQIHKKLCETYCLIGIDIPGMGASSRPHDYNKGKITPEESVNYFNDYLERWRVAMAGYLGEELTNFNLLGHSFGGFVSAQYALAYP